MEENGERNKWRVKNETYPTYSFSLNRETQHLQDWVKELKRNKELPAVVRMGLLLVQMVEEAGCPIPEDDPKKLQVYFQTFLGAIQSGASPVAPPAGRPQIRAGKIESTTPKDPAQNVDDFLGEL